MRLRVAHAVLDLSGSDTGGTVLPAGIQRVLVLHHGVLASHSRWRARGVAYGRHPRPIGATLRFVWGSPASPVPSSAPPSSGGLEAGGESHLDPVGTLGGHQSEPLSSPPVTSRDPATTASVEAPPPPAARKWSWQELMRHTFGVDAL